MSCEKCIKGSRSDDRLTNPVLQNPSEHITGPKDAKQNDFVPELPPGGGYQNIVTAMEVLLRYMFAYSTTNQDAKIVAKVMFNNMTEYSCLPTTIISDKGSAFVS